MSHSAPTSVWYPLAKRTTISLVSGSLHLLVCFCKKDEPEAEVKEKLNAMSIASSGAETSSGFVVVEKTSLPKINSDDFVVVDESAGKN